MMRAVRPIFFVVFCLISILSSGQLVAQQSRVFGLSQPARVADLPPGTMYAAVVDDTSAKGGLDSKVLRGPLAGVLAHRIGIEDLPVVAVDGQRSGDAGRCPGRAGLERAEVVLAKRGVGGVEREEV